MIGPSQDQNPFKNAPEIKKRAKTGVKLNNSGYERGKYRDQPTAMIRMTNHNCGDLSEAELDDKFVVIQITLHDLFLVSTIACSFFQF